MLKKSRQRRSRIVQTLNIEGDFSDIGRTGGGFSVHQDPLQGRTVHTKCGLYLLGPSLAAALPAERRVLARRGWVGEMSELFEHPVNVSPVEPETQPVEVSKSKIGFNILLS